MALLGPHLMGQFLRWTPFPFGPAPGSVLIFWIVAGIAGAITVVWALRPGLR
jgi:hypothetical protein